MASAQLAIDHFNARDTAVVPELADLRGCNVSFPPQVVTDTRSDRWEAVRDLLRATNSGDSNVCGVVGPKSGRQISSTAAVTGALGIPHIAYHPGGDIVSDPGYPATLGAALPTTVLTESMATYLQRPGRERQYVGLLSDSQPETDTLRNGIQRRGGGLGLNFLSVRERSLSDGIGEPPENPFKPEELLREAVKSLKDSGMRTFYLLFVDPYILARYANILAEEGMLENDYLYFLLEDAVSTTDVGSIFGHLEPGSPMDLLLSGATVISGVDPFSWDPNDGFLASWRSQNSSFVDRVNSLVPLSPEDPGYIQVDGGFFETHDPSPYASYVYDSVMAIGFGGCAVLHSDSESGGSGSNPSRPPPGGGPPGGGPPPPGGGPPGSGGGPPSQREAEASGPGSSEQSAALRSGPPPRAPGFRRREHVRSVLGSSFTGASGTVSFDARTKQRNTEGLTVGAYNIRPTPVDPETGLRTYHAVLTSITNSEDGIWQDIDGENFIYRDGTTNAPKVLRVIKEQNFLSPWVRAVGLTLFAVAWTVAIGSMFVVWKMRNDETVRSAQPAFLLLLCVGSVIMSTAIFTLSWDEGTGWSGHQLDLACSMTPWFFFMGHILMFSAMFTKLWRLDRVLQFRRRQAIKVSQVVLPLSLLMVVTVALLTAWTVVDPYVWERSVISEDPPESYGECKSEHFTEFFAALSSIIVFVKMTTAFWAWKTSDVPKALCETDFVFYAISTHLQAWFVGVPILLVLGSDSANATYFGRVLLIWIFAVSGVGLVVIPKLARAVLLRINPNREERGPRVRVSGINTVRGSSSWDDQRSSAGNLRASAPISLPVAPAAPSSSEPNASLQEASTPTSLPVAPAAPFSIEPHASP